MLIPRARVNKPAHAPEHPRDGRDGGAGDGGFVLARGAACAHRLGRVPPTREVPNTLPFGSAREDVSGGYGSPTGR
jgi:hypothetical protein